jgi:hypothetical protein
LRRATLICRIPTERVKASVLPFIESVLVLDFEI